MKIALARVASYQSWYRFPSIGLGYIAAVLEKEGIEVKIFDGRYFNIEDENLIEGIKNYCPDMVGLTAMTHEIRRVAMLGKRLKDELNIPIIVGGCHITALPIQTMIEFSSIDYGVIGEGENTVSDLIKYFNHNQKIEEVQGIVYREGMEIIQTPRRDHIIDLDALPLPAFHHYFKNKRSLSGHGQYYQIISSRGCPFKCVFCMRVLGENVRARSPKNIIEEIYFAIREYGAHTINFGDEIFLFNNQRTKEMLSKFIEAGIPKKVRWSCLSRADFINEDILKLAKKAGCYRIEIGVESGNNEILKRINKNITVEQIKSAVNAIKKENIEISTYYIIGNPGENDKTIRDTIDLAVALNTTTIAVGIMTPYPGTQIYDWAQKGQYGYKLRSTNWDDYDKYGKSVLEIEGLSVKKLIGFQRCAYIMFYIKNFRFLNFLQFIISKQRGIITVLRKQLIRQGN